MLDKNISQKHSGKKVFQNNLFMIKYAWKNAPLYIFSTCLNISLRNTMNFIEHVIGIKFIIDTIQYGRPFSHVLYYIIAVSIIISLVKIFDSYFYQSIELKGKEKLYKNLRLELYKKAANLDLSCYDNPEYYNDYVWSISEVRNRVDKSIDCLTQLCGTITVVLTTGGLFFFIEPFGLLIVFFSVILTTIVNKKINKLRYQMSLDLNKDDRKRKYINRVYYMADYAKEMRLYSLSEMLRRDFSEANMNMRKTIKKYSKKIMFLSFISDYILSSFLLQGLYIIYIVFITMVRGAISYGSAVVLLNSTRRLKYNLQIFTDLLRDFQENSLYIDKVRQFMNYEGQINDSPQATPLILNDRKRRKGALSLKNVSFRYPTEKDYTLKDITMEIGANEKIAIVGYNGAGKTTLVKLLMRLYDVDEGVITLDGKAINNYKVRDYRKSFATVFQDYQLFAANIAENVKMDRLSKKDDENILRSLDQSDFRRKLDTLDNGIMTQLTNEFDEKGLELSGGEAQKLAIARAFNKEANYIILDEPSSALDPISEYAINECTFNMARDKTVIFISHRLLTTRFADRIYMLENGRIIEQGSHEELMNLRGKYFEMYDLQSKKYREITGT
ncbi:ABC transporter ATP-binding protein [Natronospora cellulosivora (SeqCode)]